MPFPTVGSKSEQLQVNAQQELLVLKSRHPFQLQQTELNCHYVRLASGNLEQQKKSVRV